MPYSKCPICGKLSHLNVGDVMGWYRAHYPGVPVGSLVPGICFYCWQELTVGDRIIIRDNIGNESPIEPGTHGEITEILSSPEHGSIYIVRLDSASERYFVRGELRKPHDGED